MVFPSIWRQIAVQEADLWLRIKVYVIFMHDCPVFPVGVLIIDVVILRTEIYRDSCGT